MTWRGRTSGGAGLLLPISWFLRAFGARGTWLLSPPVAMLAVLCDGQARRESLRYFRRLRPQAGEDVRWGLAWRHLSSFGRVLADRMLVYSDPQHLRVDFPDCGSQRLNAVISSKKGCVLVSAHLGNWELASQMLSRFDSAPVHVVMIESEDPGVRALVIKHMGDRPPHIIDPRDGVGAALAIHAALQRGETVCMLGDRVVSGQAHIRVPFLGAPAAFPIGPFLAAAAAGCPLVPCFLLKRARNRYAMVVERPLYPTLPIARSQRHVAMQPYVEQWVSLLEQIVRRHPFQWHNFYDFWRG